MNEIWKDIAGYEGIYQVSNCGNVRSLNWGNRGIVKNLWLKPHRNGYSQVEFHKNGERKMFTVHRLVALSFVEGYEDGLVVNHKDEDKQNNCLENLEWCTTSENVLYSLPHRKKVLSRNVQKFRPRTDMLPVEQISVDGNAVGQWRSTIEIKEKLGYNDWSIKQCCRGNRKTAYGYRWRYAIQ
jgi:hypothetical protein